MPSHTHPHFPPSTTPVSNPLLLGLSWPLCDTVAKSQNGQGLINVSSSSRTYVGQVWVQHVVPPVAALLSGALPEHPPRARPAVLALLRHKRAQDDVLILKTPVCVRVRRIRVAAS